MVKKVQYKDLTEKQAVISSNKSLTLIEEQNISEGNFLIFTDEKPQTLEDINNNVLILMNAIADLYSALP